jgi:hypothetical protein
MYNMLTDNKLAKRAKQVSGLKYYKDFEIFSEMEAREMEHGDFLTPKTKLQRNVFRRWFL